MWKRSKLYAVFLVALAEELIAPSRKAHCKVLHKIHLKHVDIIRFAIR